VTVARDDWEIDMNSSTRAAAVARPRGFRRSAALALMACGAMLLIAPAVAGAEEVEGDEPVSHITIEQIPSEAQGECLPALLSLSNTVEYDDSMFRLIVTASAPLCEPIEASAVIYAMPGNGVAWPQELKELKKFTIAEAGLYIITFDKDCGPAQFDVINGVTPQTINTPLDHGPLLFPFDTGTAQQYWGCATTTTTSTTTTSTTTTSSTVPSTQPPEVLGTTTIAPAVSGASTSSTTPPAQVAGTSVSRGNAAALALTGSRSVPTAVAGFALIAVGAALFMVARRRRSEV
jgi:hypothetical protein